MGEAFRCRRCPGSPFARTRPVPVGAVQPAESFGRIGVLAAVMLVFTLVFANFFDAMGTFTGLSREVDVADERGTFPRLRSALILAVATAPRGNWTRPYRSTRRPPDSGRPSWGPTTPTPS